MIIRLLLEAGGSQSQGVSFKWLIKWKSKSSRLGITFGMLAFVHNQLDFTLNHSAAVKYLLAVKALDLTCDIFHFFFNIWFRYA